MSDSLRPHGLAYQASQFMEFSRQEYWSGLPFPSPWDLPDPGIKPRSPLLRADILLSELKSDHYYKVRRYFTLSLIKIKLYSKIDFSIILYKNIGKDAFFLL